LKLDKEINNFLPIAVTYCSNDFIQTMMLKKDFILLLLLIICLLAPAISFAHPGNTASDGCHYCWTNCERWGEVYGQRHCHGGYRAPAPAVYNPLEYMQATKTLYPNNDGTTFDIDIELADSNPSFYSVTLNKCNGCNPGPTADFYTPKFSFVNVKPGRWYMNVKKEVNNYWTITTVWTLDIPDWYPPPEPTSNPIPTETQSQSKDGEIPLTTYAGMGVGGYLAYKLLKRI